MKDCPAEVHPRSARKKFALGTAGIPARGMRASNTYIAPALG